jgi:hypothetical protein
MFGLGASQFIRKTTDHAMTTFDESSLDSTNADSATNSPATCNAQPTESIPETKTALQMKTTHPKQPPLPQVIVDDLYNNDSIPTLAKSFNGISTDTIVNQTIDPSVSFKSVTNQSTDATDADATLSTNPSSISLNLNNAFLPLQVSPPLSSESPSSVSKSIDR